MSIRIPASFLFRFSLPVLRLPADRADAQELPSAYGIVWPATLNAPGARTPDLRIGWNANGLAIQVHVTHPISASAHARSAPESLSGIQIWIDTRNMQSVHRAGRYCHSFCLLPSVGEASKPAAVPMPIGRSRDDARVADASSIDVRSRIEPRAWSVWAWLPEKALFGYDPAASPRLGFYCAVRRDRGTDLFSVDREFPFDIDPSLWSTLELTAAPGNGQ